MQETLTSVAPEIVELIERAIREHMSPLEPRAIDVRAAEDHAGEPAIFIEARYDLIGAPVDMRYASSILTPLRDLLWERGERRFPYVRHLFDERQIFKTSKRVNP